MAVHIKMTISDSLEDELRAIRGDVSLQAFIRETLKDKVEVNADKDSRNDRVKRETNTL